MPGAHSGLHPFAEMPTHGGEHVGLADELAGVGVVTEVVQLRQRDQARALARVLAASRSEAATQGHVVVGRAATDRVAFVHQELATPPSTRR